MATDQHVSSRMVLEAQLELERRGAGAFMRHLEKTEPELANFVLETLSLIYQRLSSLGGSPQKTRKAFRQVQTLLIVSIESLRRAHLELWENQMGSALVELDPEEEHRTDHRSNT
jgi:hypothetical protein